MNYSLINTINDIEEIYIKDKQMYYVNKNSIQLYLNQEILKLNEYWGIDFCEELINVFTNRSYNIFYDYEGNMIRNLENINIYHIFSKDHFIYFDRNEKKTKYNSIILFDSKIGKSFVTETQLFFLENITTVNSSDFRNGEVLWQFDISSIINNPHNDVYNKESEWEVKKFIGVLEDKLWIALNHHTIIALEVKTGQLVHRIDRVADFKCDWLPSYIPLPAATVIDDNNKKLIGFMWEFYWEINPTNGEITLIDLTNELLPQKIRNDREDFVLTNDHIYFASNSDIKVGALNRNTKEVDWFYEFEDNDIGYQSRISKIDGNDEKLGVLTNEKVLYIFENK